MASSKRKSLKQRPDNGVRNRRLNLRLTRHEYEHLAAAAETLNLPLGTYARDALIAAATALN